MPWAPLPPAVHGGLAVLDRLCMNFDQEAAAEAETLILAVGRRPSTILILLLVSTLKKDRRMVADVSDEPRGLRRTEKGSKLHILCGCRWLGTTCK